jgi:hypothetical protein
MADDDEEQLGEEQLGEEEELEVVVRHAIGASGTAEQDAQAAEADRWALPILLQ